MLDQAIINKLLHFQKSEITEHHIYKHLSQSVKDPSNREILKRISDEELGHYQLWKRLTNREVAPDRWKIWKYVWISRLFGLTFGLKLMEQGEGKAQLSYGEIEALVPDAVKVHQDESEHEKAILNLINEELLDYVGSAVLGLNDALVELTGALAGLTFALQNTRLVAVAGLITGIAASFSMAASEYLSTKSEGGHRNPLKSSLYTGAAYVITVTLLIFPYLVFKNIFLCLGLCLTMAVLIIYVFTFYISTARDLPFKKRFFEMASISLGVAFLTFLIGLVVRSVFQLDI
ncbi:MAG: VIT1/CCC1 transporter family protein [Candidatus Omnitrophica bacterium]|nr:VIT1/CCC1 transporter family protein [Candidatus Omnitrophota bacterium]